MKSSEPTAARVAAWAAIAAGLMFSAGSAPAQVTGTGAVSLTATGTTFSQNFDTLAQSGTGNTALPTGWYVSETGSAANGTYAAASNVSTSLTGNTYSFGSLLAPSDRALGSIRSTALVPTFGARFVNNTGATLTSATVTYTGEQWYRGTAQSADRLAFEYSTTATGITAGTFTPVTQLDFTSPNMVGSGLGVDGNLAVNRLTLTHTVTGLNLAPGGTLTVRWVDNVSGGQDDGLAMDGFGISVAPVPEPATVLGVAAAGLGLAGLTRRRLRRSVG